MDYSSPANQLYALLHYFFAVLLLLAILPKLFIPARSTDATELRVARFCQAVFLYVVIVYLLVTIKIYEVISFMIVVLLLSIWQFRLQKTAQQRIDMRSFLNVWFYDFLEISFRLKTIWSRWRGKIKMIPKDVQVAGKSQGYYRLLLGAILSVTAYVRFYDAAHSASPALSDGVVTLAWMKYISARMLFNDDIYPQGFHIILSLLSKFTGIDQLYVLKYTGPLNGVLTAFVLYFTVSRLAQSKYAGIVAATVFGFGANWLFGGDWVRQAATNSQEFALVFVFPACYFILKYFQSKSRSDLWAGLAACSVAGFVHTLVFVFTGMLIGVALIASLLVPAIRSWRRAINVAGLSVGTVILSYAPIQIARWSGIKYNESAADFLTSSAIIDFPSLNAKDYAGLISIVLIAASGLIRWRDRTLRLAEWFAVGTGVSAFLLYYAVPTFTRSVMLSARSETLWTLAVCFCIGFAWMSVRRLLPLWKPITFIEPALCSIAVLVFAFYVQLQPITTYKMEWESATRMYLKIAKMHNPKTWTIFSNEEGYALVYGNGWHQFLWTLVEDYDPKGTPITRIGQDEYDSDVTPVMYVFQEKNVYKLSPENSIYGAMEERYAKRERYNKLLDDWINKYTSAHGAPTIVFEDENLRVYLIERPDAADKENRRLWGTS